MKCGACGETIEGDSRFCRWCGSPASAEASLRVVASDRRFATVLFADIVDSTAMVRGLEPEHALERLSPILEAMKRTVIEHGGTICRDQGDGIMASFGAPISDDRHAVNACMAALALIDRAATAAPFATTSRVGVHSGLVVGHLAATSSGTTYAVSGEAVHLAARLESNARIGTALVSEATWQLVEGQFAASERKLEGLKGFNQQVVAFELQRPARPVWSSREAAHAAMAFHGRDAEMALLTDLYGDTGKFAAVISGDPAVGKSRLVRELLVGCVPRTADVYPIAGTQNLSHTPFAAVRRLMLGLLGLQGDAAGEETEFALLAVSRAADGRIVADEAALRALLGLPGADRHWMELEPRARLRRIGAAITELLSRRATGDARSVVLVEDLHWVDSASMAVLAEVLRRLERKQFLFLTTTRDVEGATKFASALSPLYLRLEPLSKGACEAILDGLVGRSRTLLRLKGRLLDGCGGTPLFLQQLVQWLVENRALVGDPGNYRLAVHADQLELPASLHATVLWRADRLPARSRQIFSIASVLQQGIASAIVSKIGSCAAAEAQSELEFLVDQGLLVSEVAAGEAGFAFRHALLREAVYEALVEDRRIELHAEALRCFENLPPDQRAPHEGLMALHAYASRNWPAVATYSRAVGETAAGATAYREAAAHFEQAIDALYRLPRVRAQLEAALEVRLRARMCYSAMAKHDLCLAHVTRAHELAMEIGDPAKILICDINRVGVLVFTGPLSEARELGIENLRRAEAMGSVPHIAIAGHGLGQVQYASGAFQDAIAAFSAVRRHLVGDNALLRFGTTGAAAVMCGSLQATAHVWLGEFADAAIVVAHVGEVAAKTKRPFDVVSWQYAEAFLLAGQGAWQEAVAAYERALNTCKTNEIETYGATIASQLGLAYIQAGRVSEAATLMEPALEEAVAQHNVPPMAMLKRQLGFAALCQNDFDRAERFASEAVELAGQAGIRMTLAISLQLQGMIALRRGGEHLQAGLDAIEKAVALAEALGMAPTVAAAQLTRRELEKAIANSDLPRKALALLR